MSMKSLAGITGLVLLGVAIAATPLKAQDADTTGHQLFFQSWVGAETESDGLGPLYNEASCHACHWFGGGARIFVRESGEVAAAGVLLRHTFPDGSPDPFYGVQLQNKAVGDVKPEGIADLSALKVVDNLTRFVANIRYRSGPGRTVGITRSLRAAPALDAAGLIAQVADASILEHEDPTDVDGDGISGRAHKISTDGDALLIGRFNWKATMAKSRDQITTAFWFDMGMTTDERRPPQGECTRKQIDCLVASGSQSKELEPDITAKDVDALSSFVQSLGSEVSKADLPAMPDSFVEAKCAACHVPEMKKRDGADMVLFSDLLLHDMGGELTSYGGEGDAAPTEWRTTPLVGYRGHIAEHRYLHDGRAATIDEAIRWHGGEAEQSAQAYANLSNIERLELTTYVHGLLTAMPMPEVGGN